MNGIYHGYRAPQDGAPTLVFANSLGTDLRVWDRVVAELPEGWGILRQDKRGHGLSQDTAAALSIETMTDDVEALLDYYGIGHFTGVGLSVGGLIMQRLALRRAGTMTHLVLSDTAAKIGSPEIWNPRIETVLASGIQAISDAILARWFAPGYDAKEDFSMWRLMLERTPAQGYADVCAAIRDADYTAELKQIQQPTLVLCGSDDCSTPPELVKATADGISNASFVTIADAGHLPCVEQPSHFTTLLRDHVAK
ncbi:3-oxoadipate enol-lactonase (plasmid) [Qingshengfaniella alkalisoli]|uniref:3-oxoadipate enol-lactonase n=1 Tax=Qingshengfaniella alkalisoli TaxID=2599296 RepID=A0A5B8IYS2_9RHOB|nr:3-oxoadipate enol-lactonase [Qingshengfaniella alkalisoli]